MEKKVIIYPTEIAQWYSLLNEAQAMHRLSINSDLEHYLIVLLMRFTRFPKLVESILALEFLEGLNLDGHYRQDKLRDLGDKCLLFSGFFPERAKRYQVHSDYFIQLGQSAYSELSHFPKANLYYDLSENFVSLSQLLNFMKNFNQ